MSFVYQGQNIFPSRIVGGDGVSVVTANGVVTVSLSEDPDTTLRDADIGVSVQAYDADLAAIAALSTTSFGRSLLTLVNQAGLLSAAGAQASDADLTAIAALTTTSYGRAFLALADAAAARTAIGVIEGTFTPTVAFATPGTSSISYSVQSGYYYRPGSGPAFIQFSVSFNPTLGTASGVLLISCPSLPFNFDNDAADRCGLTMVTASRINYLSGQNEVLCRVNNASSFRIALTATGAVEADSAPGNFTGGNTNALTFSGWVKVA